MHVLPCGYIFKVNKDVGPKIRVVGKGFRQAHGVDYSKAYAPVVTLDTLRIFFTIMAHQILNVVKWTLSIYF